MSLQPTPPTQAAAKQYHATNSPWEAKIGYYRAVRRGPFIFVSGTTAVDPSSNATDAKVLHPGDAKAQAHIAFQEIIKAIQALGGRGAESINPIASIPTSMSMVEAVNPAITPTMMPVDHIIAQKTEDDMNRRQSDCRKHAKFVLGLHADFPSRETVDDSHEYPGS
ncbi:hypothetical protein E4T44_05512 [Aureobasidium sp. EXF-8845]|nr:hypothetical protein E4T44_05512 [Aureobasidium sp. EXF-8845]KAI4850585.1 hypothetical protein E4T45_05439 [Aureobasidium sp. EXF-8846]